MYHDFDARKHHSDWKQIAEISLRNCSEIPAANFSLYSVVTSGVTSDVTSGVSSVSQHPNSEHPKIDRKQPKRVDRKRRLHFLQKVLDEKERSPKIKRSHTPFQYENSNNICIDKGIDCSNNSFDSFQSNNSFDSANSLNSFDDDKQEHYNNNSNYIRSTSAMDIIIDNDDFSSEELFEDTKSCETNVSESFCQKELFERVSFMDKVVQEHFCIFSMNTND